MAQHVRHVLAEVLDDQLHLLHDIGGMQRKPPRQGAFGVLGIHPLVFLLNKGLANAQRHFVRGIVLQYIQDEALLSSRTAPIIRVTASN